MPEDMEKESKESQAKTVSRFREVLPQVLAMSAANMIVVVLAIALFFSTLVIAEVHNKEGPLCMDDTQASWFGSLPFFFQPIGALASGYTIQKFGRKKAMMFINIPYCLGIVMLSVAPSVTVLFLANALIGTTVGFTEAPVNSYFGEICQPELRSILAGSAGLFYNLGMFLLFVLGTFLDWKTTGAVLTIVPIISLICVYKPGLKKKALTLIKLLLERETRRPLVLIVLTFMFCGFGGMYSVRPFLIEVLEAFHVPINAMWGSVLITVTSFVGILVLIAIVNRIGKRMCILVTTAACAICCLLLGLYAYFFAVPAARTGDQSYIVASWIPLVLFCLLSFFSTIQGQVPWLLVAECFPFRTRGIGGGMAAASYYVMIFFAINTYLITERNFDLFGAFWFYGTISVIGFVYLYFHLPETEGKSLEEIEQLFAAEKIRRK